MQPEAEQAALRERLSRLVFRLDASDRMGPIGREDRIRLTIRRDEAVELKGAISRTNDEIRRLKQSMSYPSPVQLAEESVRTRRLKLKKLSTDIAQYQRLLVPFKQPQSPLASTKSSVWQRRLEDLRREHSTLLKRLQSVDEVVRDKHNVVVLAERKLRDAESAEIAKLQAKISLMKCADTSSL